MREFVKAHFASLGQCGDDFRETILIRGGVYCGRRYECGPLSAVWFVEENEIKFYGEEEGPAQIPANAPAASDSPPMDQRVA